MSRLVRAVRSPDGEESAYATPDGGVIVRVPQDFAFADTVTAFEEDIPTAPLSARPSNRPRAMTGPPPGPACPVPANTRGPWNGGDGLVDPPTLPTPVHAPYAMMPMMDDQGAMLDEYGQPMPPMYSSAHNPYGPDPGLVTRSFSAFSRARNNVETVRHEMRELWDATRDEQRDARLAREEDPFLRLAGKIRRLRNMWSFFEWDQDDKVKAMWIGIGVFAVAIMLAVMLSR